MVNQAALEKIEVLLQEYKYNWGKEADLTCIPAGMSQEKLVEVLERVVETGESILAGLRNCRKITDAS